MFSFGTLFCNAAQVFIFLINLLLKLIVLFPSHKLLNFFQTTLQLNVIESSILKFTLLVKLSPPWGFIF